MKLERSDVEFLLWRKKVDWTLVHAGCTPIPNWVANLWEIEGKFSKVYSKRDPNSKVTIRFKEVEYLGWVTRAKTPTSKKSPFY